MYTDMIKTEHTYNVRIIKKYRGTPTPVNINIICPILTKLAICQILLEPTRGLMYNTVTT